MNSLWIPKHNPTHTHTLTHVSTTANKHTFCEFRKTTNLMRHVAVVQKYAAGQD